MMMLNMRRRGRRRGGHSGSSSSSSVVDVAAVVVTLVAVLLAVVDACSSTSRMMMFAGADASRVSSDYYTTATTTTSGMKRRPEEGVVGVDDNDESQYMFLKNVPKFDDVRNRVPPVLHAWNAAREQYGLPAIPANSNVAESLQKFWAETWRGLCVVDVPYRKDNTVEREHESSIARSSPDASSAATATSTGTATTTTAANAAAGPLVAYARIWKNAGNEISERMVQEWGAVRRKGHVRCKAVHSLPDDDDDGAVLVAGDARQRPPSTEEEQNDGVDGAHAAATTKTAQAKAETGASSGSSLSRSIKKKKKSCVFTVVREPLSRFASAYNEIEWRLAVAADNGVSERVKAMSAHQHALYKQKTAILANGSRNSGGGGSSSRNDDSSSSAFVPMNLTEAKARLNNGRWMNQQLGSVERFDAFIEMLLQLDWLVDAEIPMRLAGEGNTAANKDGRIYIRRVMGHMAMQSGVLAHVALDVAPKLENGLNSTLETVRRACMFGAESGSLTSNDVDAAAQDTSSRRRVLQQQQQQQQQFEDVHHASQSSNYRPHVTSNDPLGTYAPAKAVLRLQGDDGEERGDTSPASRALAAACLVSSNDFEVLRYKPQSGLCANVLGDARERRSKERLKSFKGLG